MVKVLFDHNMPPCLARGVHEIILIDGHEAFALRDKFQPNISDIDYFNELGRDWIVISKDLQNSRKKAERAAILRKGVVAFYLSPALQKKKINEQAGAIFWHWDKMLMQRENVENGLFQLPENKSRFRSL
ncbi:MAG: PIN-like domain-containing protein [Marinibacterium sp.]